MCLQNRIPFKQTEQTIKKGVNAFKIFTRDENGLLQSTFVNSFKKNLKYPSNQRIRVDQEDAVFFAFENYENAIHIASIGRKKWGIQWRMVAGDLIVLPVTIFDVISKGMFFVPSDDSQCMDGNYPAFEAKEIVVHDNPETRNLFLTTIFKNFIRHHRYGLSKVEKEAIVHLHPELADIFN